MSVFKSFIFILFSLLVLESPLWGMEPPSKDDEIFGAFGAKLTISGPDDFQEEAEKMFPDTSKFYPYEDIQKVFNPTLLHLKVQPIFKQYFDIMFNETFPRPAHSNKTIVMGFRCLYKKMAFANASSNDEEKIDLQLQALHQLLAFHKKSITHFDKTFGDQIPAFPCESCLKTANKEYEIPTNENKADSP